MRSPKGTLVRRGAFADLTFRRVYRHAIEHVWAAISTPEGLREWLLATHVLIEPRVGGRIELVAGPPQYHSTGSILAWDPPRVFEYEWNVAPVAEMPRGERIVFRYELTPEGDATHLLVTVRHVTAATARGYLPGVHVNLDRLEAQLAGLPLPDWLSRFAELRADYPKWSDASHPGE